MPMDIPPLDVLCIEDTFDDFLLVERTLRGASMLGYCYCVEDSDALTAALADRRCHVVLSDYAVPGIYFTDTLRRFHHHYLHLPPILVSGTASDLTSDQPIS
jgi:DNA-binding NtrC family response regulator